MKRLLISVSDYITDTLEIPQSLDERLRGILLYNSRLSSCPTLRLNSQVHLGLEPQNSTPSLREIKSLAHFLLLHNDRSHGVTERMTLIVEHERASGIGTDAL